jgi:hypothetical protein
MTTNKPNEIDKTDEIEPLIEGEIVLLAMATDEVDWNCTVKIIKNCRGGKYPPDWFEKVLAPGGIMDVLKAKWGKPNAFDMKCEYPEDSDGTN